LITFKLSLESCVFAILEGRSVTRWNREISPCGTRPRSSKNDYAADAAPRCGLEIHRPGPGELEIGICGDVSQLGGKMANS